MKSKYPGIFAALSLSLALGWAEAQTNVQTKVLVLNPSGGYAHTGAINGLATLLQNQAPAWNLAVTISASASNFTLPYLRGFDVIVLNNNTSLGNVITGAGQSAFIQWMQEGGGAVGFHGAMDHSDSWKWYTDNMAMTKFAGHSSYCGDANAKVMVDTTKTAGAVRAKKPEYAALLALLPATPWTWCDEWYSLSSNPRNLTDVLMTIDETTFKPSTIMGDYPVTWTVKLPPLTPNGKQGKYFYSARGHEAATYNDPQSRAMVQFALCWGAGRGLSSASCQTVSTASASEKPGHFVPATMAAGFRDGALRVSVQGTGEHKVEVSTLSGRKVALQSGTGNRDFSFPGLRGTTVYLVKVKSGDRTLSRQIIP